MTTFALVHGAWHDAWCWHRLTPLLAERGHAVVAVDLPAEDGSAGFDAYADTVCAALDGHGDDVVVVGHSLGGNTIPLVAARRPVRRLVYLCALVPAIGRTLRDQVLNEAGMLNPLVDSGLGAPDSQRSRAWIDLELARSLFYGDCDGAVADAALARLRPQSTYPYRIPFPLNEFPPAPSTYIVCRDDAMVGPDWSRRIARERLGAEIVDMPGDHSPFLSHPGDLAAVLLGLEG